MKKQNDDQKREDEITRRMLNTPPKHRTAAAKSPAKKPGKKTGKKKSK